jgi:sugar phosphate permease
VPITILAETGVNDREYGLASGLLNTSQQVGGALALAVLTTIATSRTNHLIAAQHPINQALTLGFRLGFLAAAGFVLLAIIAAATIGTRPGKRSQLPQPARHPEPHTRQTLDQQTTPTTPDASFQPTRSGDWVQVDR